MTKSLFKINKAAIFAVGLIAAAGAAYILRTSDTKAIQKIKNSAPVTMSKGHQAIALLTNSHTPD